MNNTNRRRERNQKEDTVDKTNSAEVWVLNKGTEVNTRVADRHGGLNRQVDR